MSVLAVVSSSPGAASGQEQKIRQLIESSEIVPMDYRKDVNIVAKDDKVLISVFKDPNALEQDCKIDAILMSEKVSVAVPAIRVVSVFSTILVTTTGSGKLHIEDLTRRGDQSAVKSELKQLALTLSQLAGDDRDAKLNSHSASAAVGVAPCATRAAHGAAPTDDRVAAEQPVSAGGSRTAPTGPAN